MKWIIKTSPEVARRSRRPRRGGAGEGPGPPGMARAEGGRRGGGGGDGPHGRRREPPRAAAGAVVAVVVALATAAAGGGAGRAEAAGGTENPMDDLVGLLGNLGGRGKDRNTTECDFHCPSGETPVPRPGWDPKKRVNGCGTDFTGPLDFSGGKYVMTPCCNKHDICFDTCGTDYNTCDDDFKTCMRRLCRTEHGDAKECHRIADLYYSGVRMFGCGLFAQTQGEACVCPSEEAAEAAQEKSFAENTKTLPAGGKKGKKAAQKGEDDAPRITPGKYCATKSILIVSMLVEMEFHADRTFDFEVVSTDRRFTKAKSVIFARCKGNQYSLNKKGVAVPSGKKTKCWKQLQKVMGAKASVETFWEKGSKDLKVVGKYLNLVGQAEMKLKRSSRDRPCKSLLGKGEL